MSVELATTSTLVDPASTAASAYRERVIRVGSGAVSGVLTEPLRPRSGAPAVMFLTAGLIHRVGPNRMHVMLARELAADGFVSVRFDLAGIGDSEPRSDGTPADEAAVLDTQSVMEAVQRTTGARTFVLVGLCSGAVASFHAAGRDERVRGLVLLNPQGFDHDPSWNAHVQNLTQARRYVTTAASSASNWKRALTGRINYRRAVRVLSTRIAALATVRPTRMPVAERLHAAFEGLRRRDVRMLTICCEGDSSIDYMTQILGRDVARGFADSALQVRVYAQTDHSFTLLAAQQRLLADVRGFLRGLPGGRS